MVTLANQPALLPAACWDRPFRDDEIRCESPVALGVCGVVLHRIADFRAESFVRSQAVAAAASPPFALSCAGFNRPTSG
jgi:hypothetical protein